MDIKNKVVVHFLDGTIMKGYTYDFNTNKEIFHLIQVEDEKRPVEVSTAFMKAVFFVKTFEGNENHRSPEEFSEESVKGFAGLKIKITFSDGEVMYGATHGYTPNRKGFFMFPADKESNNERAFVIQKSTTEVKTWR